MQLGNVNHNGTLPQKAISFLGGHFSFFEKCKRLGTGSPRLIYEAGIKEFDQLKSLNSDTNYLSAELLKEGIVLRFKKRDQFYYAAFQYAEIDRITIVTKEVSQLHRGKERIVKQASIQFVATNSHLYLHITPTYYQSGIAFFKKSPIQQYCHFETVNHYI